MGGKLHSLPPLKRFILMQNQNQNQNQSQDNTIAPSNLPAKKRKQCRDPPPWTSNLPAKKRKPCRDQLPSTPSCCLPAKKRVWAIHPLDLNTEYNPISDDEAEEEKRVEKVPVLEDRETEELADDDKENREPDDDDGIVCAVCESTDGDPSDPIVLCDGCDLMVHTTCYGHPLNKAIPEGDWFCARCEAKPEKPLSCSLCPVSGGALKPTRDGKWAHIVCALFVPEVFFADPEGREGIDCSKVPKRRWEQKCYVCKSRNGCVVDCSEPKCPLAFHVTCGLEQDLCIEYNQGRTKGAIVAGFCRVHSDLWEKQQQTGKFKIVARDEKEK